LYEREKELVQQVLHSILYEVGGGRRAPNHLVTSLLISSLGAVMQTFVRPNGKARTWAAILKRTL
jgi:hypothetical protein